MISDLLSVSFYAAVVFSLGPEFFIQISNPFKPNNKFAFLKILGWLQHLPVSGPSIQLKKKMSMKP